MSKAKKIRKLKIKAHRKAAIIQSRRIKRARARALYGGNQQYNYTARQRQQSDEDDYREWIEHRIQRDR